jgi:ABC-type oligopeptide transport system substrate-binding subunit
MTKLAVRLLVLSMSTALLAVSPIVTQVEAATSSKQTKKRVVHQHPKAAEPAASSKQNDFDGKPVGGGY